MRLNLKITLIAVLASLPFVLFADLLWVKAESVPAACDSYWLGDQIFSLGSPLTQVILAPALGGVRPLSHSDHYWAIPSLDALFLLQWIIWAQVIFGITLLGKLLFRHMQRLCRRR